MGRSQKKEVADERREGKGGKDRLSKKVWLFKVTPPFSFLVKGVLFIQRGTFYLIPLLSQIAFPSCTQGGKKLNPALDNWNVTA